MNAAMSLKKHVEEGIKTGQVIVQTNLDVKSALTQPGDLASYML